jgi:hypothetical protein
MIASYSMSSIKVRDALPMAGETFEHAIAPRSNAISPMFRYRGAVKLFEPAADDDHYANSA